MAKKKKRQAPQKECPKCKATMHAATAACPKCEYRFKKKPAPKKKAANKPATKKAAFTGLIQEVEKEQKLLQERMDALEALRKTYRV